MKFKHLKKEKIEVFGFVFIAIFLFLFSIMTVNVESLVPNESWIPPEVIGKDPTSTIKTENYTVEWYEIENTGFKIRYIISVQNLDLVNSKNPDIAPFIREYNDDLKRINSEHLYVWDNFSLFGSQNNPYDCSYLDNSSQLINKQCDNFTTIISGSELRWKETNRLTKIFTGNTKKSTSSMANSGVW